MCDVAFADGPVGGVFTLISSGRLCDVTVRLGTLRLNHLSCDAFARELALVADTLLFLTFRLFLCVVGTVIFKTNQGRTCAKALF